MLAEVKKRLLFARMDRFVRSGKYRWEEIDDHLEDIIQDESCVCDYSMNWLHDDHLNIAILFEGESEWSPYKVTRRAR